jgi:hypothetical protein
MSAAKPSVKLENRSIRQSYDVDLQLFTVRITKQQMDEWPKQLATCTTNQSCADHAMAFLEILPRDEYTDMVKLRNITPTITGRSSDEIQNIINKKSFHTLTMLPGQFRTEQELMRVFSSIPRLSATMVLMLRDQGAGHVVILSNDAQGIPFIYDTSAPIIIHGIQKIQMYIQEQKLNGSFILPCTLPRKEYRGTKRMRPQVVLRRNSPSTKKTRRTSTPVMVASYPSPKTSVAFSPQTKRKRTSLIRYTPEE